MADGYWFDSDVIGIRTPVWRGLSSGTFTVTLLG